MVERGILLGHVRQPALDLPGGALGPPQSEKTVHLLALLDGLLLDACHIELALLEERLLLEHVEVADVAHGALAGAQFGGGALGFEHQLADLDRRLGSLERHHGLPHLGGQLQHGAPDTGLGRIQLGCGHPLAEREREQVEEVLRQEELAVDESPRARGREADARSEARVPQKPGLHEVRLRDTKLLVGGNQPLVPQQRDLDGSVGSQRAHHEIVDVGSHLLVGGRALVPMNARAAACSNEPRHVLKAFLGRDGSAPRHGEGAPKPSCALHGVPPSLRG